MQQPLIWVSFITQFWSQLLPNPSTYIFRQIKHWDLHITLHLDIRAKIGPNVMQLAASWLQLCMSRLASLVAAGFTSSILPNYFATTYQYHWLIQCTIRPQAGVSTFDVMLAAKTSLKFYKHLQNIQLDEHLTADRQ